MSIVGRIRNGGISNAMIYFLGRFYTVRAMSRAMRARSNSPAPSAEYFIEDFEVSKAVSDLRDSSVHLGLRLRPGTLHRLLALVEASARTVVHQDQRVTATPELLTKLDEEGSPALIVDHNSVELHDFADEIARDPRLLEVVAMQLGSFPSSIDIRVQESRVVTATREYRESRNQTVMFHFDVHALNFIYVFFYLTDVDSQSGAHELIPGSHRKKKLAHLLSGARKSDAEIHDYYGGRSTVISGAAGSGFIEDTSCFHRALPPIARPRLALQIRYS